MKHRNRSVAFIALTMVASVAAMAPAVDARSLDPIDDYNADYRAQNADNLRLLALVFSELPQSVSTEITPLSCGQSGHCNRIDCDTTCPPGESKNCTCSPTEIVCEDTHSGTNPFDNDKHNTYECSCDCRSTPPPEPDPECTVDVGGIVCVRTLVESAIEQVQGVLPK